MSKKINVIYVDDERNLLELVKIFLERNEDISVEALGSIKQAIEFINEKHPSIDVIISDYQMPGMSITEFLENIKDFKIPFIIFTGRNREEIVFEIDDKTIFYLQKGGIPIAQLYVNLADKIRQIAQTHLNT
ncbi:MAG: response regulator [Candidatus Pacebacteria bacterium]|nr:response regulator [Candidatus Paceibacterota bacterium]